MVLTAPGVVLRYREARANLEPAEQDSWGGTWLSEAIQHQYLGIVIKPRDSIGHAIVFELFRMIVAGEA